MRWFKHFSDASDDSFIEGLEEKFGLEGYARWWKLLEIIARSMDKTDCCSATHSWVKWQSFLKGKRNKLETFLEHCQNESRITLKLNGNILEIKCPNLLKLKDEYNSKSGQPPDTNRDSVGSPNNKQQTTDTEVIITNNSNSTARENLPVDNSSPPDYGELDLNNFFVLVGVVRCLFGNRELSKPEQELLSEWIVIFDMRIVMELIKKEMEKFRERSHGSIPNSLMYFKKAVSKLPRNNPVSSMAKELAMSMRIN